VDGPFLRELLISSRPGLLHRHGEERHRDPRRPPETVQQGRDILAEIWRVEGIVSVRDRLTYPGGASGGQGRRNGSEGIRH
jgi:hypothetical protein